VEVLQNTGQLELQSHEGAQAVKAQSGQRGSGPARGWLRNTKFRGTSAEGATAGFKEGTRTNNPRPAQELFTAHSALNHKARAVTNKIG